MFKYQKYIYMGNSKQDLSNFYPSTQETKGQYFKRILDSLIFSFKSLADRTFLCTGMLVCKNRLKQPGIHS
jgi:hypothetical protein